MPGFKSEALQTSPSQVILTSSDKKTDVAEHAHVIGELVVVRRQGVLTAAEQYLVKKS